MENQKSSAANLAALRRQVEELLKDKASKAASDLSEAETLKLIHELEVYQIELELQNEELRQAKSETQDAVDLYDFAPTGYFTLNQTGEIIRLNHAGAEMLGKDSISLIHSRFGFFVSEDSRPGFNFFLEKATKNKTKETCELKLVKSDNSQMYVQLNGIVTDNGNQYLLSAVGITDRKHTEDLLLQTRQNYEAFFNSIDDFLFVLDEHANIIHTNTTVMNRLGYSWEELCGKSVLLVHPPERRDEAGRIVGEMLMGKAAFCPVPLITKSGIQIPVETRVTRGVWDGNPAIFGVTKDISKLKLSEEKFSKLFHLNPSACGLSDLETHKYVEVNQVFYDLFGFTKEDVIGKTAFDLGIFSIEAANAIMLLADSKGNVSNAEAELRTKNGSIKHTLLSSENIYIQDKKYRFTVVHDITERKKAEAELRESSQKFEAMIAASPDGIGMVSLDGKVQLISEKLAAMYGFSIDEKDAVIGKSLFDYIDATSHPLLIENIHKLLASEKTQKITEYLAIKKDNSRFYVDVNSTVLYDSQGNPESILFIERDITERKQAENEIKLKSEALQKLNAEKDKFFSIIAHDLKSPFNSILGFSDLLVEQVREKNYAGIEKYAGIILNSSQRALDLLMNLMEWTRSQTGRMEFNPEYLELVAFIKDITPLYDDIASQKSITIKQELPANVTVFADKGMINTVFRNLISNAIKFTNPGGKIIITAVENHGIITISVKDNGVGISPESRKKLFRIDENHSTRGTQNEKGTGLGLILCREFIDKHGGQIRVESEVGKGSTFYFSLPALTLHFI